MAAMKQTYMALGTDFCTVAWAAEFLQVSIRTVGRLIRDGKLDTVTPLSGSRESKRHKSMLYATQVRAYREALEVVRGAREQADA